MIDTSDVEIPDEYPADEWTPKQKENWENHGKEQYELIEGELGREWFRRCWRPKKRGDGLMERDHVKIGTPEDYVVTHVDDTFDPWGSMTAVMMRNLSVPSTQKEVLDDAVDQIVKAKLRRLKETNPEAAKRLLEETTKVGELYGVI